jgi:hypothetical protein
MKISKKCFAICVVMTLLATLIGTRANAGVMISVEAAGMETSTVSPVTTETFNSTATGLYSSLNTSVGVLSTSGAAAIVVADVFGGAGGTGNYFALGAQSGSSAPVTLTFSGPQSYFGFWWSAGDVNNTFQLLNGTNVLATYTTATAFAGLGLPYFGNPSPPNQGGDSGEPFAYFNFNGTGGTKFTSVVFSNNGSTGTGFEADNFSINAVPEPSSLILSGTAALIGGLALMRRRRRALTASTSAIA